MRVRIFTQLRCYDPRNPLSPRHLVVREFDTEDHLDYRIRVMGRARELSRAANVRAIVEVQHDGIWHLRHYAEAGYLTDTPRVEPGKRRFL